MKFYITTPIFYVNDAPHIGHSYTVIICDIIARWKRLNNYDVLFSTGTDEHGLKIAMAAKTNGVIPEKFCDTISMRFKKVWKLLNISHTDFIRTTEYKHFMTVQKVINILFKNGFIYKRKYSGLYCTACERFYVKKDLDENELCYLHKIKPIPQSEQNYFFKLSNFKTAILERIINFNHKEHIEIHPKERRNEIIGKLKNGIDDISFSRLSIDWGIPVPFDKTQTVYVWVDALINYITVIGYCENSNKFKKYWPVDVHLMAKDILWFHSVIWPAILMAIGLPLPKKIYSHGFFTLNGRKMSKSLGNIISPEELINKYGVDATRYLIVSLVPFDSDGDISWEMLTLKYNNDLANNLGNLLSRIIMMAKKYFVTGICYRRVINDLKLVNDIIKIFKENFVQNMDNIQLHKAVENLQKAITFLNKQIEIDTPWKLIKTSKTKVEIYIYSYLQAMNIIAIHLLPFMPLTATKIWHTIGTTGDINEIAKEYFFNNLSIKTELSILNTELENPNSIFPRIY
ncbi:MAG: class I tRNA ligase family protein [Endomicrobium sp.]|jgi:methionyl-tRNA synthetase|nr:class I tRNA ligase family protein [Endomicrobium sp.]